MSENLFIGIASQFDAKGFKQAEAATTKLDKTVKKLAVTVASAFSAQKVLAYSKASIRAYADDQKAAALLSNQLKNLGLAYAAVDVEGFIAKLQTQTGILDDELRPAFANLVRVTGSVAQSQKLMTTAFDASRGSGLDFASTVKILTQAYVGNKKGLRSLNLGLTQAEISAMSFDEILTAITKQFKGAGAASIATFAGKLDLLKVSTENAKETIGEGFVDAFTLIADNQNFKNVINDIDNAALNVADMIRGVASILSKIDSATPDWLKALIRFTLSTGLFGQLAKIGAEERKNQNIGLGGGYYAKQAKDRLAAAAEKKRQDDLLKKEREKTKLLKEQTAQKRAQAAIDKANLALSSAENVFDLERVSVAAAMTNQTLTDNERKRLEIKQAIFALEDAIDSQDTARITKQTQILNTLLGQFSTMQKQAGLLGQINALAAALGVSKDLINLKNLQDALDLLLKINAASGNKFVLGGGLGANGGAGASTNPLITAITTATSNNAINAAVNAAAAAGTNAGEIANALTNTLIAGGMNTNTALTTGRYTGQAIDWWNKQNAEINALNAFAAGIAPGQKGITIQITENAKNLVDVIYDTVTEQSASGNPPIVTRVGTGLAW